MAPWVIFLTSESSVGNSLLIVKEFEASDRNFQLGLNFAQPAFPSHDFRFVPSGTKQQRKRKKSLLV
jgi:hypothetical protein